MKMNLMLGLLLAGAACKGQGDPKTELLAMNKLYMNASSFSMNLKVSVYKQKSVPQPNAVYLGEVKKSGNNYYSRMMTQRTVSTETCFLVIDDERKSITYGKPAKPAEKMSESDMGIILDSLFLKSCKARFAERRNGRNVIEVSMDKDLIYERVLLTVNSSTHALEELTYYYKTGTDGFFERVTISYSDISFNTGIPSAVFSEKNYVTKSRGKLSGAGKYMAYTVSDQSNFNYKDYE